MRTGGVPTEWKVIPIAPGGDVFKSPDPEDVFLGSPSIAALPGGRIVVSFDTTGPGVKHLPGTKGREPVSGHWLQGKVFVSGDKGKTWTCKTDFPFHQAQLFRIGNTLYLMGLAGSFRIMRSVDGGDTWSKPAEFALDDGEYAITPSSVLCTDEYVYLAVMKWVAGKEKEKRSLVPVILRARQGVDLANRKAWTSSEPGKSFQEFVPPQCLQQFGIQISPEPVSELPKTSGKPGARRPDGRLNWDAPHLVEIVDPNHSWRDARRRTLYLLAEVRTQRRNLAAIARVVEDEAGKMVMDAETVVGSIKTALIAMPGGHLKFDVIYDGTSKLYWLACNPCPDTMTRFDKSSAARSSQPRDDRQQLHLYYSRNLVDWCFAAWMDSGSSAKDWRHFCSLAIGGSDLYAVCCSGSAKPGTRGYTDRITFHCIPAFRELVY